MCWNDAKIAKIMEGLLANVVFLSQWFWNVLGMFWTLVGSPMKSDEVRSFRWGRSFDEDLMRFVKGMSFESLKSDRIWQNFDRICSFRFGPEAFRTWRALRGASPPAPCRAPRWARRWSKRLASAQRSASRSSLRGSSWAYTMRLIMIIYHISHCNDIY